jgi:hypothetical protein
MSVELVDRVPEAMEQISDYERQRNADPHEAENSKDCYCRRF